ncbi:hypothetical protein GIW81_05725 [Hyphomicrobium sp. xq]|uniref:Lectin-like protein BA14k n=1 Tax=Hyphomicrobium album TaxID=2665159 RepID=A0A6I3KM92_9HYPH|nr:hypothetical protein [Hyphomicrobium album]MTD93831.1 hypothetical protein [Hyphomicrobium album]
MYTRALCVALLTLSVAGFTWAAHAAPSNKPYASDAHRGVGGAYGGLKSRGPSKVPAMRDRAGKEPYDYRYYSDTDRSPGSCRRYAQRAIATKNSNWWTRYTACLK